jgi:broad specificity phosphatase PhoE
MHLPPREHGSKPGRGALDLLVARHGNTFAPGDPVTWVGRHEDLPLVAAGLAQAEALGVKLAHERWRPDRVLASSLRRTRGFAERALFAAGWSDLQVERDPRLDELDYGPWGGLTSAEIEARGDGPALAAWSEDNRWPRVFNERESDVRARIERLAEELTHDAEHGPGRAPARVLIVSSNGVMRYFLGLAPGELARRRAARALKVGTGRVCRLRHDEAGWRVLAWDLPVDALELPPPD